MHFFEELVYSNIPIRLYKTDESKLTFRGVFSNIKKSIQFSCYLYGPKKKLKY